MINRFLAAALASVGLGVVAPTASAQVFFFDNGGGTQNVTDAANWDPDGLPPATSLTVHNNGALPAAIINADFATSSLRLNDGGSVEQSANTLTITAGGDVGLFVGELGPAQSTYTLSGGTIAIEDDPFFAMAVGLENGSVGVFNMSGGLVTNATSSAEEGFFVGARPTAVGTVNLSGGVLNGPAGVTHIGLDGSATWNQDGGTFNAGPVQVGRFQSPVGEVNLSDDAVWSTGLVLLADGHAAVGNTNPVNFSVTGPDVSVDADGFVIQANGNVNFDGTGGGVSTIDLNGGQFALNDGELFLSNLPSPTSSTDILVLIDNIGAVTGSDAEFDNAPDGLIVDGVWEVDYVVGADLDQVRLVSVIPEPGSAAIVALAGVSAIGARRRR